MTPFEAGTTASPIAVHKQDVVRTTRYATTGAAPSEAEHLWIAFHGYGQRAADFIAPFADAVPANVRVIAPEGLSRFYLEMPRADGGHLARTGATWLTRDDREDDICDTLAMLHAVVGREYAAIRELRGTAPTLHVLGFSQGVAMSMRWVGDLVTASWCNGSERIASHVLWAGGLAHDVSDEQLRAAWHETIVHVAVGNSDRFATEAFRKATQDRLVAIGVAIEEHPFAGGHRLDTPLLRTLLSS